MPTAVGRSVWTQSVNINTDYVSIAGKLQKAGFGLGQFNLLVMGVGYIWKQ